jgi:uncharacterized protein YqgC (DUF456 family)
MLYVYASLLVLVNTVALFLVPFGLPGTWIMALCTAILAWWQYEEGMFSIAIVVFVFVLAAVAEILDLVAAAVGARCTGGSRRGSWGGIIGGIIGAIAGTALIPVPVLGTIFGGCLGAFLGAVILEWLGGWSLSPSLRSGGGAAAGRLFGTLVKLGVGVIMWVAIAIAAFWP